MLFRVQKLIALLLIIHYSTAFGQSGAMPYTDPPESRTGGIWKMFENNHEAESLTNNYDVTFYYLDLNVSDTSTWISGFTEVRATALYPADTFALELVDTLMVDSVHFNNTPVPYQHQSALLQVFPASVPQTGESFSCRVYYHGYPPQGGFFNGVTHEYDSTWQIDVTWTLSEPFNARQWFPVKQDLMDKADSAWIFLTVPPDRMAGSNGLLEQVVVLPDDRLQFRWKTHYPIDYYLLSYSVSDYFDYSIYSHPAGSEDSVLIQNYLYDREGFLESNKINIDRTATILEQFSELLGPYPFDQEKYGHCMSGLSGGMEHQTMTTLGGFSFSLISHELAHMWFGDEVTCSNWQDIWINEGFATYSDYLAHEFIAGQPWPPIWLGNVLPFVKSEPDGSVYVPLEAVINEDEDRIFDARLTYYKGALLLHMIRYELNNDDLFFGMLQTYVDTFGGGNAGAQDFINVLNTATGKDFTGFFDQWYYGEGFPIIDLNYKIEGNQLIIHSVESVSAPDITPFFDFKYPVHVWFSDGQDTVVEIHHTTTDVSVSVPAPAWIDSLKVDPDQWILMEVASIQGIGQSLTGAFRVFPNPCDNMVFIDFPGPAKGTVTILRADGTSILSEKLHQGINQINLAKYPGGIYLVNVHADNHFFTKKVIKH
ncbi:MAG: M1 family aminopeptidase [Bacteroidales bacterium]